LASKTRVKKVGASKEAAKAARLKDFFNCFKSLQLKKKNTLVFNCAFFIITVKF
jgi:hypothetical protein